MLFMKATKNYAGVTIYGDYHDLRDMYNTVSELADVRCVMNTPKLSDYVLGLCYDIRHAYQGDRETTKIEGSEYFGFKILIPMILLQYQTLRWAAGFAPTSSSNQANLFRLQASIEQALKSIDSSIAEECMDLVNLGGGVPTNYLVIYWDKLNGDYMKMTKAQRKNNLVGILRSAHPISEEYREFEKAVLAEAAQRGTDPFRLELSDSDEVCNFKW